MNTSLFVTVDAETELIAEGSARIAQIREELEQSRGCRIPITWFVRFQRSWTDSVHNDRVSYFESALQNEYDGFNLLGPALQTFVDRGDEVGWHYHAYHYMHREELSHEIRIRNINADLGSCAAAIRERYPELGIRSFRWGWFFLPDIRLQNRLRNLKFDIDASIRPGLEGKPVNEFNVTYPEPVTVTQDRVDGIRYFPFVNTVLVHDYNVLAHDLGWSKQDEQAAARRCRRLVSDVRRLIQRAKETGAILSTYREAAGIR